MSKSTSTEKRVLNTVRKVLTRIARETAVPHGTRHPLSDAVIKDMKACLALISAREREIENTERSPSSAKPYFIDERKDTDKVTVKLEDIRPTKKR